MIFFNRFCRKNSAVLSLLVSILSFGYSQSHQIKVDYVNLYDIETVYLTYFFWKGVQYVKNDQTHTAGLFYGNLIQELSDVPKAHALAKKGSKKLIYGVLTPIVIIPAVAVTGSIGYPHKFWGIFIGGYLTSLIVGIHLTNAGKSQINEAIWIHNREVIQKE